MFCLPEIALFVRRRVSSLFFEHAWLNWECRIARTSRMASLIFRVVVGFDSSSKCNNTNCIHTTYASYFTLHKLPCSENIESVCIYMRRGKAFGGFRCVVAGYSCQCAEIVFVVLYRPFGLIICFSFVAILA